MSTLTHRSLLALALWLTAGVGGSACSNAAGDAEEGVGATTDFDFASLPKSSPAAEKRVRDLITAVTPLEPSAPAAERNSWFPRRKKTLERMREADEDVGIEALRSFGERENAIREVRGALLDVAAHAAPERTRPLLVQLFSVYGGDMSVRQKACRLLGSTAPETAIELIEPIFRTSYRSVTYPPDEQILYAYVDACELLETEPVELLIHVATNLTQDARTRQLAAEELGKHESSAGRQALETLIVESAGNNYLRREAAQSLLKTVPRDELCARIRGILANEADTNFQLFLADMLDKNCQ